MLQCRYCAQVCLHEQEDYGGGFDAETPYVRYPQPRQLSRDVPETLRRDWDEARICFENKAFTACALMVRRVLEGICHSQGETKGVLEKRLRQLRDKGVIDSDFAEWASALRVVGNRGAHNVAAAIDHQDAEDSLAFAEALLEHVFVVRRRFREFRRRIDAKASDA